MVWEIIGWLSTAIVIISMMQTRIMRLRVVNLVGCLGQIVYNGVIGAWPVVGLNAVLAVIQVWNIWRLMRTRHDGAAYDLLALKPTDQLAQHTFAHNEKDIAKFNPAYATALEQATTAFVVMRGNEVVGLTLAQDTQPGVAHLVLDYVTEKYRDLTPGEFLFSEGGWFSQHGYHRITAAVTGPDYYRSIGFREENDAYVKTFAAAK